MADKEETIDLLDMLLDCHDIETCMGDGVKQHMWTRHVAEALYANGVRIPDGEAD